MRIQNNNNTYSVNNKTTQGSARSGGSSFSVPQENVSASPAQKTTQSGNMQDVGALLALQSVEDSLHGRRRKAVRRGNKMLDLLEQVRLGLLGGSLPLAVLQRLERLAEESGESGDERIDAVLAEIGLRAQVEIAKMSVARGL